MIVKGFSKILLWDKSNLIWKILVVSQPERKSEYFFLPHSWTKTKKELIEDKVKDILNSNMQQQQQKNLNYSILDGCSHTCPVLPKYGKT